MTQFKVSEQSRQEYFNDGVTVLRGVVSPEWLARLADAVERDIAKPGPFYHGYKPANGQGNFHGNLRVWENDDDFRDFCLESALPAVAQQFFASDTVHLLYDQLFVKEPGTLNPTRWHNDQPYWPIRGQDIASFWLSLDPVNDESGRLEFVRGSHRWNRWFQPETFGEGSGNTYERNENFEAMPDINAQRDKYDIVSWDLEPGDVYVFHGMTLHGANGNRRSDMRRRGYTVRYTGDDIRYDIRKGLSEPICNAALKQGDAMHGPQYPQVYP